MPGYCHCRISSGQVHLMDECKGRTNPSLLCVHLCSVLQCTGPMGILDSHQFLVLLGATGTGGWAGQALTLTLPWSLVEELALKISPGQWRGSHLRVGLFFFLPCFFSPLCLSIWSKLCVRAAQGVRCDTHRLSSWPAGHLLDWIAGMPVHMWGWSYWQSLDQNTLRSCSRLPLLLGPDSSKGCLVLVTFK